MKTSIITLSVYLQLALPLPPGLDFEIFKTGGNTGQLILEML